jgi:hypothetical protein
MHLHNHLGNEETKDDTRLVYTRSEWMAADIYTKQFGDKAGWQKACELVNIIDPEDIKEVIERRAEVHKMMESDTYCHPNNIKPNSANSATHRKWMKFNAEHMGSGQATAAVTETVTPIEVQSSPEGPVDLLQDADSSSPTVVVLTSENEEEATSTISLSPTAMWGPEGYSMKSNAKTTEEAWRVAGERTPSSPASERRHNSSQLFKRSITPTQKWLASRPIETNSTPSIQAGQIAGSSTDQLGYTPEPAGETIQPIASESPHGQDRERSPRRRNDSADDGSHRSMPPK